MEFLASLRKTRITGITLLILILFNLTTVFQPYKVHVSSSSFHRYSEVHRLDDVQNHTLGFEKILALNLPERSDKRDGMSLAASLTNITIDYIDGVKGEAIIEKAYPWGDAAPSFPKPQLGSWRAHMNAIRTVVEKGLSTALILEDDVDWDIRIKDQLSEFAAGTKALQGYGLNNESHSPYGDNWDLLWIGHCHGTFDTSSNDIHTFHDLTTVSTDNLKIGSDMANWLKANWPDHTRLIHGGQNFICSYAYAISHRGVEKLLWNLSVKHLNALFDNALSGFCENNSFNLCIGAYPSYFWPHEARGGKGKNSDNNPDRDGMLESVTKNLQWPVRMNVDKLIMGRTDFADSWPDRERLV